MSKSYMPDKMELFHKWQLSLIVYLLANALKWKIPLPPNVRDTADLERNKGHNFVPYDVDASPVSAVLNLQAEYEEAYSVAINKATRTSASLKNLHMATANYKEGLHEFLNAYVANNKLVTDGDRTILGIPVYKKLLNPSEAPDYAPAIDIEIHYGRRITVNIFNPKNGRKAIPYGMSGAVVAWAIGDHILAQEELTNSILSTRTPYVIQCGEGDNGKIIYLSACWQTKRGMKGPWCMVQSVVIPQ
jgi:hypothetical protein